MTQLTALNTGEWTATTDRIVDFISHTEDISLWILALDFPMGKDVYAGCEDGCENWCCVLIEIKNFACICKTNVLKK